MNFNDTLIAKILAKNRVFKFKRNQNSELIPGSDANVFNLRGFIPKMRCQMSHNVTPNSLISEKQQVYHGVHDRKPIFANSADSLIFQTDKFLVDSKSYLTWTHHEAMMVVVVKIVKAMILKTEIFFKIFFKEWCNVEIGLDDVIAQFI